MVYIQSKYLLVLSLIILLIISCQSETDPGMEPEDSSSSSASSAAVYTSFTFKSYDIQDMDYTASSDFDLSDSPGGIVLSYTSTNQFTSFPIHLYGISVSNDYPGATGIRITVDASHTENLFIRIMNGSGMHRAYLRGNTVSQTNTEEVFDYPFSLMVPEGSAAYADGQEAINSNEFLPTIRLTLQSRGAGTYSGSFIIKDIALYTNTPPPVYTTWTFKNYQIDDIFTAVGNYSVTDTTNGILVDYISVSQNTFLLQVGGVDAGNDYSGYTGIRLTVNAGWQEQIFLRICDASGATLAYRGMNPISATNTDLTLDYPFSAMVPEGAAAWANGAVAITNGEYLPHIKINIKSVTLGTYTNQLRILDMELY